MDPDQGAGTGPDYTSCYRSTYTMIPGDMIEWVYKDSNVAVDDEELWSSSMQQWIPIGGPALVVSVTKNEFSWLSERGLYSACTIDNMCYSNHLRRDNLYVVVPKSIVQNVDLRIRIPHKCVP